MTKICFTPLLTRSQGCQKIWMTKLKSTLVSWSAKIQPKLRKLWKMVKVEQKLSKKVLVLKNIWLQLTEIGIFKWPYPYSLQYNALHFLTIFAWQHTLCCIKIIIDEVKRDAERSSSKNFVCCLFRHFQKMMNELYVQSLENLAIMVYLKVS